ncbi:MAG: dCTP deaminase [Bifidobacteriaceae bacterium]|jgi:dCTP deaminase|nr:dCTP deaminase [Bifidobacteriaceae bacterium]
MLLSDNDIRSHIESGEIELSDFDPKMIQPSSIDVRLDKFFRVFDNHKFEVIDPAQKQDGLTRLVEIKKDDFFVLHPGEFALASTYEFVKLGNSVAARLEGKSSLGRLGLLTHSTAGFIDPGFNGHITLELSNVSNLPIKLYPGMKIGQLCFMTMSDFVENPYGSGADGSRYQDQRGPTESRSYINFYKKDI